MHPATPRACYIPHLGSQSAMESLSDRFERAVAEFDRLNGEDPTQEKVSGVLHAAALAHADRVQAWVLHLNPEASEALRLSTRCQHLMRFRFPRSDFPEGRVGYLQWRKAAMRFHATEAEQVLKRVGYDNATISKVKRIVMKQGLNLDADVQTMEDALCLAFLEHDFPQFLQQHPEDKVLHILRTTWDKMSDAGRAAALELVGSLPEPAASLVQKAELSLD
ncbi:MAG: DUF4202 domain-containing protein [Polyangiaceae bacterium]